MLSRRALLHGIPALGVAALLPSTTPLRAEDKNSRAYALPDLPVVTHQGRRVRFYTDLIQGKIVLINFMYSTCKGICPGMTTNLKDVYRALGDRVGRDVFMYSITLQPEKDTPERLHSYVKARGIGAGWYFLTGEVHDLDQIRKRLGFYDPNPQVDEDRAQHTGMLRVGNDARQRWTMCPALAEPSSIIRSVSWM